MDTRLLSRIDLNLLVVFDAVMAEGSVKRAAQRLEMKSPAVSQALSRLREAIGEELFIRARHGLRPTPRACQIWQGVRSALALIGNSVSGNGPFDPASEARAFVIDLPAGADTLIIPQLRRRLSGAPGLDFRVSLARAFNVLNDLRFGECWLALDFRPIAEPGYRCQKVTEQTIAMISRPGHPALTGGLTPELYQSLAHVALASARTTSVLPVNEMLEAVGYSRSVRYTVPSLLTIIDMVSTSDLVATLPRCTITYAEKYAKFDVFEIPFDVGAMPFYLIWHDRFDVDTAHIWLRQMIAAICADL